MNSRERDDPNNFLTRDEKKLKAKFFFSKFSSPKNFSKMVEHMRLFAMQIDAVSDTICVARIAS